MNGDATCWLHGGGGCFELRVEEGQHLVVYIGQEEVVEILCRKETSNVGFVNRIVGPCMSRI